MRTAWVGPLAESLCAMAVVVALGSAGCDDAAVVECTGGERIAGTVTFCWYAQARPGPDFRCPSSALVQITLDEGVACTGSTTVTRDDVRGELCTRLGIACGAPDTGPDMTDGGRDAALDAALDAGRDAAVDLGADGGRPDSGPDASDGGGCGAPSCLIDDACVAAGTLHPEDPCLRCDAAEAADAWSRTCESSVETTFDDFADGTMPRSLAHLHVSAAGDVRWLQTRDLDNDDWTDIVISNHQDDTSSEVPSYVYFGGDAGFSPARRVELDTTGADGSAIADIDQNGWPDIVVACGRDDRRSPTPSFVFWGSDEGYSSLRRQRLLGLEEPTTAAVGDLDRDGWLDVVLVELDGAAHVYPGSASGLSDSWTVALGSTGGYGVTLADLDVDGWLDVVVGGQRSSVHWGSAAGFVAETELMAAADTDLVEVADLNADGTLDLILSRHWTGVSFYATRSPVLWGRGGRSFEAGPDLPTNGAIGVTVADLDRDEMLDIVLTGYADEATGLSAGAFVYLGTPGGYSAADRFLLPSHGSFGCEVVDYDRDGFLDVFVANNADADGPSHETTSDVFYGSATGFGDRTTRLPSLGAHVSTSDDLGNVYDRRPEEQYVSSPIDLGHDARALRLTWTADTPGESSVELQLRSFPSAEGLEAAPWLGPSSATDAYTTPGAVINTAHVAHRYFQYRVVFRSPGFRARPALQSVTLYEES